MATKKTKTSNVVALKGDLIPGEACAETVACLERLLALARSGEIVGVCYGAALASGRVKYGSAYSREHCWTLMAAANFAAQDILDRHRQENDG